MLIYVPLFDLLKLIWEVGAGLTDKQSKLDFTELA